MERFKLGLEVKIAVGLRPKERELITEAARKHSLTRSEFIRTIVLSYLKCEDGTAPNSSGSFTIDHNGRVIWD